MVLLSSILNHCAILLLDRTRCTLLCLRNILADVTARSMQNPWNQYQMNQTAACTLGIDSNLQRHRAVSAAIARLLCSSSYRPKTKRSEYINESAHHVHAKHVSTRRVNARLR